MELKWPSDFDGVHTLAPGESHLLYGAVPPQKVKIGEIPDTIVKTAVQQQWNITYTANV